MADYQQMNCDPIARWYRVFEYLAFGRRLEQTRCQYLAAVAQAKRVLILGDGDGRFTAELVRRNPAAQIDFVDLSPRMVHLARNSLVQQPEAANPNAIRGHRPFLPLCRSLLTSVFSTERPVPVEDKALNATVRFVIGDARTIPLDGPYDLVVTHFFLDCFRVEDLPPLVARIASSCAPNARWAVSEFALPPKGLRRWAARALIRFMYFFFRITTGLSATKLPDYVQVMAACGFRLTHRCGSFLVSEIWERIL